MDPSKVTGKSGPRSNSRVPIAIGAKASWAAKGRALLDDGSMVGSPFMGNWSRAGHLVTIHFLDNVSNGAQNFVKWTLDLREETVTGVYYPIK